LKTRKWLLEKHVRVELTREWSDLAALVQHQACDLAILCHTLQPAERQNAIDLLTTASPKSKILCLVPILDEPVPGISDQPVRGVSKDACVPTDSSAHALVRMVLGILESSQTGLPA